jgi:uncharacterized membrane protein
VQNLKRFFILEAEIVHFVMIFLIFFTVKFEKKVFQKSYLLVLLITIAFKAFVILSVLKSLMELHLSTTDANFLGNSK